MPPPDPARSIEPLEILRAVLRAAPVILWAIDATGTYTFAEGRGLDLVGIDGKKAVGRSAFDVHQENPTISQAIVRALGGEACRTTTNPQPGVFFDNWYVPLRAQGTSEVHAVVGIATDASERANSNLELQEKLGLIERQSATIRSLATPIIEVWDEVLCLPVIGTVDSARTADMMQELLSSIVRREARYAIIDLTGVEVVDTSTADHLIKLLRAAKVLGVEGILTGIRPAVAQTIVAIGLDLAEVRTMRSLRDALKWCIRSREARLRKPKDGPAGGGARATVDAERKDAS